MKSTRPDTVSTPTFLEDVLQLFADKYPGADLTTQHADNSVVTFLDPATDERLALIEFTLRPEDQAIEAINAKCYDLTAAADTEQWFQQLTVDLITLSNIGMTAEDVWNWYASFDSSGYHSTIGSFMEFSYDDANRLFFDISFTLPEVTVVENYFQETNIWDGSSVTDGQFQWLYTINVADSFNDYFSAAKLPLEVARSGVGTGEGDVYVIQYYLGTDAGFLELEQYYLMLIADNSPHFQMAYSENMQTIEGADRKYYYGGCSPELLRQFPIALSLLCDDGMTPAEATELFSHALEPTAILEDFTLTVYCPREVAHCLTSYPDGNQTYVVMTKTDYEMLYGRVVQSTQ